MRRACRLIYHSGQSLFYYTYCFRLDPDLSDRLAPPFQQRERINCTTVGKCSHHPCHLNRRYRNITLAYRSIVCFSKVPGQPLLLHFPFGIGDQPAPLLDQQAETCLPAEPEGGGIFIDLIYPESSAYLVEISITRF